MKSFFLIPALLVLAVLPMQGQNVPKWNRFSTSYGGNGWSNLAYDPVGHGTITWMDTGTGIYSNQETEFSATGGSQVLWTQPLIGGGTSGQCPSNATFPTFRHPLGGMAIDTQRNRIWMSGGVNQSCPSLGENLNDLWYVPLASSYPSGAAPVKVCESCAPNTVAGENGGGNVGLVYDSADDVLFMLGPNAGGFTETWSYCPSTTRSVACPSWVGSLDTWVRLFPSNTGPVGCPGGNAVYDAAHSVIVTYCPTGNTWAYVPGPSATWTQLTTTGPTPPANSGTTWGTEGKEAIAFVSPYVYVHAATPSDYVFNYATLAWQNLGNLGGSTLTDTMAYDASAGALITFDTNNLAMWVGTLSFANNITVTNTTATSESFHPVQIGRAFKQGEILAGQGVVASIGATSIPLQVDSKEVWPDGSLKFAVLSFTIPTFAANTSYAVVFQPGTNTTGNTPQTLTQMLASGAGTYNFDAQEAYTVSATTKTASARSMLLAMQTGGASIPNCETVNWTTSTLAAPINACYWTKGPIATTVVIANHDTQQTCNGKTGGQYDLGFDSFCSIRPAFEATFWPAGLNGAPEVKIRFVGEISNSQQLEDVNLTSLVLYTGNNTLGNQTQVYSRNTAIRMTAGSRWTLRGAYDNVNTPTTFTEFWMGGTPVAANIAHNVSYLASTTVLPNYDSTKSPSASTITTAWNNWLNVQTVQGCANNNGLDIYDYGELACGQMTLPGGKGFLGPLSAWTSRWLYSGDYRMAIEALGNTELLGMMPHHFREGNSTKNIVANGVDNYTGSSVNGLGRIVSTANRPTFSYNSNQAGGGGSAGFIIGATSDGFATVGTFGTVLWTDPAHMPQIWAEYLLSGDFYYLEESEFWSAYATWFYNSGTRGSNSRGPTGAEGTLPYDPSTYQTRGMGWTNLSRLDTWAILPDASPEKTFFDLMNKDALTGWEAAHSITNGYGHTNNLNLWNWATTNAFGVSVGGFTPPSTGDRYWSLVENGGAYLGPPPSNMNWFIPDFGSSGPNGGANCYNGDGSHAYPLAINYTGFNGIVSGCQKNFMVDYIEFSIGRSQELGYNSAALEAWLSVNMIAQAGSAVNSSYPCTTFNPWLLGEFVTPEYTTTNTWYQSWSDVCSNFSQAEATAIDYTTAATNDCGVNPGTLCSNPSDPESYWQPFEAAASYAVAQPGGAPSWNFISANLQQYVTQDLRWAILPRTIGSVGCSISPTSEPAATVTQTISNWTFAASNCGTNTLTWSVSGVAPTGLSGCNTTGTSCTLSGTLTTAGTFTPTVNVTDGGSNSATDPLTLTVNAQASITTASPLPSETQGTLYSTTLTVTGGTGTSTCSAGAGLAGSGLTVNSNCTITGTAGTPGVYSFTVTPTDANNVAGTGKAFSLTINSSSSLGGSQAGGHFVLGGNAVIH